MDIELRNFGFSRMDIDELAGARWVERDKHGYLYLWHGGETINVLDEEGNPLEAHSVHTSQCMGWSQKLEIVEEWWQRHQLEVE